MSPNLKVAAVQMTSGLALSSNLRLAGEGLQQAAAEGAQLAVLPENFAGYGVDYQQLAKREAEILDWLSEQAQRHGLSIIAGSLPSQRRLDGSTVPAPRVVTRSVVVSADGVITARYDKIHLFDASVEDAQGAYRESSVFEPGSQTVTVDVAGWPVGLAICYDLRFPALALKLAAAGARLLVYPSAFTAVTGAAHWSLLLRATAVQTGCYVLGANQCGEPSPKRATFGHSMLVDPWGDIVKQLGDEPGVLVASLSEQRVQQIRNRISVLKHQRLTIEGPYEPR